jgi:hypothetical protein
MVNAGICGPGFVCYVSVYVERSADFPPNNGVQRFQATMLNPRFVMQYPSGNAVSWNGTLP